MKGIVRGRKKRKFNGHTFYYWSIIGHHETTIEIDELKAIGESLPVECQKILRKIDLFHVPMTPEEQAKMLHLCSLSLYCWRGGPMCNLPGISMEDYTNEFYIEMCSTLRSWKSDKAPWPAYVKYVRLHTLRSVLKRWERIKSSMEVDNFHALDLQEKSYEPWASGDIERGTTVENGRRVQNANRDASRRG